MSQVESDHAAIKTVVADYIERIARADTEALVSLFAQDGVVMAPDAPTMEGAGQLKAFFDYAFTTVRIDPKIHVDEVVTSGDYAFARCHSEVKMTLLEPNASHVEENRELFVFRKDSGEWKIARYMFNRMSSTRG